MREGWTYKKLGEVATIVGGSTPKSNIEEYWGGSHYWVTPADLKGNKYQGATPRTITDLAVQKTNLQLLPIGTVLLSSRAPIGKVAITTVPMYCNQGFKNVICSQQLLKEFVYWYLSNKTDYLNSLGRGATFKEISKKDTEQIPIPVPPIEEQERIVSELDLLSGIIEKKKEQLKEYDKLAQSIFYDMFGDPIENPKGWEVKKLGEVATLINGFAFQSAGFQKTGFPIVRISNIQDDKITSDFVYFNRDDYKIDFEKYEVLFGDILIAMSGATTGKVGINYNDVVLYLNQRVGKIVPRENVIHQYLFYYLKTNATKSLSIAQGVAQPNLSTQQINSFVLPLPPLSLQQLFAEKIEAIEKQKALVQQSISETQTLFDSTMDKYFG